MKKSKLLMPIIGIGATVASLAPLATLSSCNKNELKVELSNNTAKENKLYANTKTINLFFKQNNINNVTKTRVQLVNLKINGAEATTVSGLTKLAVDSSGGIRVTLDIATMYSHYSNPSSIEFDLLFSNKSNNQSCIVSGFAFNVQEAEIPNPFNVESDTVIAGFNEEALSSFTTTDIADAYPSIFTEIHIIDDSKISKLASESNMVQEDAGISYELDINQTLYKMVIPSKFTAIKNNAFIDEESGVAIPTSKIPSQVISLEFQAGSKMATIGEWSFAYSPFVFVSLPKSIETLGVGVFFKTSRLISLQFAPELSHSNGLAIPGAFAYGTILQYVKLPTYINKISTYDFEINGEPQSIPAINFISDVGRYIDLSEWTTDNLNNLSYTKNAISAAYGSFEVILSGQSDEFKDSLSKVFDGDCTNNVVLYDIDTVDESLALTKQWLQVITPLSDEIQKFLQTPFLLNKIELPNTCITVENEVEKTIDITSFSKDVYEIIATANQSGLISSIVLPNKLTIIPTELFAKSLNFWQIYIPSTVTSISFAAFADSSLSSIMFDGTSAEWENISKAEYWNADCPEITVTCTDGTIIIPSTRKYSDEKR